VPKSDSRQGRGRCGIWMRAADMDRAHGIALSVDAGDLPTAALGGYFFFAAGSGIGLSGSSVIGFTPVPA
jgi:hypothetical protein